MHGFRLLPSECCQLILGSFLRQLLSHFLPIALLQHLIWSSLICFAHSPSRVIMQPETACMRVSFFQHARSICSGLPMLPPGELRMPQVMQQYSLRTELSRQPPHAKITQLWPASRASPCCPWTILDAQHRRHLSRRVSDN